MISLYLHLPPLLLSCTLEGKASSPEGLIAVLDLSRHGTFLSKTDWLDLLRACSKFSLKMRSAERQETVNATLFELAEQPGQLLLHFQFVHTTSLPIQARRSAFPQSIPMVSGKKFCKRFG